MATTKTAKEMVVLLTDQALEVLRLRRVELEQLSIDNPSGLVFGPSTSQGNIYATLQAVCRSSCLSDVD